MRAASYPAEPLSRLPLKFRSNSNAFSLSLQCAWVQTHAHIPSATWKRLGMDSSDDRLQTTLVSVTLRAVVFICMCLGFAFVSLGNGLGWVAAMCRDASKGRHGNRGVESPVSQDRQEDGAPVWYYDVKPTMASGTPMLVMEGRKWYAVRKGREVGIFDTWETCKSHVHGYRGSEFKSFRNLNDAHLYLQQKK